MIRVAVRGLDYSCWRCGRAATCVVAVHAEGARASADWLWFEDKHALTFARDLLQKSGNSNIANTIKERFSRTAGSAYLSNGCEHCDAIQGDWPLGQSISDYAQGEPLCELPVLITASISDTEWAAIVSQRGMIRSGYAVEWPDLD